MAKNSDVTVIKKYANRRLYNTGTSTYVTLENLASMVKGNEEFVVQDAKTGEDITHSVLTQIIFEQENKGGQNLMPIAFLRQLIRFYGDQMQMLVPGYLEHSMSAFAREQEGFREKMAGPMTETPIKLMEAQVSRNAEIFRQAMTMFNPFMAGAMGSDSDKKPEEKAELGDLQAMRRQLDEMQKRLEEMDAKKDCRARPVSAKSSTASPRGGSWQTNQTPGNSSPTPWLCAQANPDGEVSMVTSVGTEGSIEGLVKDLILRDREAIAAYELCIERLSDAGLSQKIAEFKGDHLEHLVTLNRMARQLEFDPPDEGDAKQYLTTGKIALADMIGDAFVLKAMRTNEDDTVSAYERAFDHGEALPNCAPSSRRRSATSGVTASGCSRPPRTSDSRPDGGPPPSAVQPRGRSCRDRPLVMLRLAKSGEAYAFSFPTGSGDRDHAGLEVDVMRTAQLAQILVFDIGRRLEGVRRTAHAALRRGRFSFGYGHVLLRSAVGGPAAVDVF